MNGTISAGETPGGGLSIIITLPAAAKESEYEKILIIEDNQEIAELEQDFLEANAIESDIETDGIKGLDRALHGTYDLILLDIMLPGMDGFHICKRIRAEKEVPILMVSAKREDIDKIRGLGLAPTTISASLSARRSS